MTESTLPPELSPRRRPRRTGTVAASIVGTLGAVAILGSAATGYAGLRYSTSKITTVSNVLPPKGKSPARVKNSKAMNILIVGSDSRKGLGRNDQARLHVGSLASAEGQRSDVTMLLHIGAGAKKAELVSFPRDSWVQIPEHTEQGKVVAAHHAKLNDAYHDGGGGLAVSTIEELTKVHIDHYIEVNFLGFVKMVQAVNGVDICSTKALKDEDSGLDIKAGTTHLDETMALKFARARHLPGDDFARIQRQQQLIAAIMRKTTSSHVLLNPISLTRLVNAATSSLTIDNTFTNKEFLDLAKRAGSLSPSRLTFVKLKVADPAYWPYGKRPGEPVAVKLDDADNKVIFDRIRNDEPVGPQPAGSSASPSASASPTAPAVTVKPGSIRVRVKNGSGIVGKGKTAAADLTAAGYAVIGAATNATTTGNTATTIRYDPSYSQSVKTLQAALPGAVLETVPGLGRTFQVIVGTSYTGVKPVTVSPAASSGSSDATASPQPTIETKTAADATCA